MTTNKPEVVAYARTGALARILPHPWRLPVVSDWSPMYSDALIRLSDYEALQAECEKLRKFAEKQPAPDVSALPDALIPASPDIEYLRNVSHGNSIPALLRGNIMSALRWIDTLQTRLAHPQPASDVSALVEALSILGDIKDWDCNLIGAPLSIPAGLRRRIQNALAAHRKGGES